MTTPLRLPLPPLEMRQLVGPLDDASYDNATGSDVFPDVADKTYGAVFDFGCGCGRIARQLIQQTRPPKRYVGLDHHAGMVRWCQQNFTPLAQQFSFIHHDVEDMGFNPGAGKPATLPFPVKDREFSFILAYSVFTHIVESSVVHYLHECARILSTDGILRTTWFLFDKRPFPMMQEFQNALYVNAVDPTNAVIYDKAWLRAAAAAAGLAIGKVTPPTIRGYHWFVDFVLASQAGPECAFPDDVAPLGSQPPPVLPVPGHSIG
jgi:SAM-dependent methyltransferase